jgi:uncharacterized protein (DUF433 family)
MSYRPEASPDSGALQVLLNTGIYTIPQACRFTAVSSGRIRRWLKGYRSGSKKQYAALWSAQLPVLRHKVALGFLDLIEIKFVGAFLDRGVSWPMLHKAREKAAALYPGISHPFCTGQFVTDGSEILAEVHQESGQTRLLELATNQQVFAELTQPFFKQFEFDARKIIERWWPLGLDVQLVLDPRRNFGQPIVHPSGIPTAVLAKSFQSNQSVETVADWYELEPHLVRQAVDYEQSLAT